MRHGTWSWPGSVRTSQRARERPSGSGARQSPLPGAPYHVSLPSTRATHRSVEVSDDLQMAAEGRGLRPRGISIELRKATGKGQTRFPCGAGPAPLSNFNLVDDCGCRFDTDSRDDGPERRRSIDDWAKLGDVRHLLRGGVGARELVSELQRFAHSRWRV